jgi:exodeoxyribonuclease V gamma subunit
VLVAELLDYAAAATEQPPFCAQSLKAARQCLSVEHPLQPFSLVYFVPDADPRRRSFNVEYCEALRQRLAATPAAPEPVATVAPYADDDTDDADTAWEPRARFFESALGEAGEEFREVTLDHLARFFRNPCRYLLRERLGIALPRGDEELQDEEPFVPDFAARRDLAERMLPSLLAGGSVAHVHAFARAGIEYPAGRLGDLELEPELQRLATFARELAPALAESPLAAVSTTLEFEIDGQAWRLTGGFGDLRKSGLIRYRYDNARAGDYLQGWIAHLFLNAWAPAQVTPRTTWHSRDGQYVLPALDGARRRLETLLRLYRDGLHRPLHFFPKSAWEYMTESQSLSKAVAVWRTTRTRAFAEDRDAAYRLPLRGVDQPLDGELVD